MVVLDADRPVRSEAEFHAGTVTGHASAGGLFPADVDFLNREVKGFLMQGGDSANPANLVPQRR